MGKKTSLEWLSITQVYTTGEWETQVLERKTKEQVFLYIKGFLPNVIWRLGINTWATAVVEGPEIL